MRKATLYRTQTGDAGTFGMIVTDSGFNCKTGELPERGNQHGLSCIPAGSYTCTWRKSPSKGFCYHVENVPGRSDILIHAANLMGDKTKINPATEKHYESELEGCIAPGKDTCMMHGQMAIESSRTALTELEKDLHHETFELTIVEQFDSLKAA